jgi:hypothetical protein
MKSRIRLTLGLAGGLLAVSGIACAHPAMVAMHEPGGLQAWENHHPEASRELGAWVSGHRDAARKFFEWDARHPERSHEFVTWAITHRGEGIEAFAMTHRGWEFFDEIMLKHKPAANDFIGWCRHHPDAAEELMNHPGGLDWAGHHLWGATAGMENGRR